MLRALVFSLGLLLAGAATAQERPLAIVGATLIDGSGGPAVADATVILQDGRILAAGPAADVAVPADAERLDAAGRWIIPGLIDAHVHLFQSGGLYTRPDAIDLRDRRPYAAEIAGIRDRLPATLARYLASGVTGIVDFGGPEWTLAVRDELRAAGRAMAAAGPLLATYAPPELAAADPPIVEVNSVAEADAVLDRLLPLRPDFVKIWFVRPPEDLEPDLAWVRHVAARAGAAGIPVAAHATQLRVAEAMVEAGATVLVHSIDDAAIPDSLLAAMEDRGIAYIPTLAVRNGYTRVFRLERLASALEQRVGDPEVITSWAALRGIPGYEVRTRARSVPDPVMADNLRRAHQAGVLVAAGSDAGNIGTLHGAALHEEMELMVAGGLSPMDVLVSATANGAKVLGRDDIGTIAPGKVADLVILSADPLADIRNTTAIWRVVVGGRVATPEEWLREGGAPP